MSGISVEITYLETAARLGLAMVAGTLLGLEREYHNYFRPLQVRGARTGRVVTSAARAICGEALRS
jgi:uncharacterized membrane protein YhiD involved in acid resistance